MEKTTLKKLNNIINIQGKKGNWDSSPYMVGLWNGLIMARAIITGKEPKYRNIPKKFNKDL